MVRNGQGNFFPVGRSGAARMDAETEKKMQEARKMRLMKIAMGDNPLAALRAIDILNKMDGLYLTRAQIGINTPPAPVFFSWREKELHPEMIEAAQTEGRTILIDDIQE